MIIYVISFVGIKKTAKKNVNNNCYHIEDNSPQCEENFGITNDTNSVRYVCQRHFFQFPFVFFFVVEKFLLIAIGKCCITNCK